MPIPWQRWEPKGFKGMRGTSGGLDGAQIAVSLIPSSVRESDTTSKRRSRLPQLRFDTEAVLKVFSVRTHRRAAP